MFEGLPTQWYKPLQWPMKPHFRHETLHWEGAIVVMTARREAALEEVSAQIEEAGGKTFVMATDISKPDDPERLMAAVEEKYGKIDVLWLDYSYPNPAGTDMIGETWEATKLVRMVRELQPEIMLDNRLECGGHGFGSLMTAHPNEFSGDFVSPEQILPPEGIRNVRGERVPWELCTTMNNNWGYNPYDTDYKPASMLIRKLVECVSKGGNMILNVGPDANGRFNDASCRLLDEIGTWLAVNGESIYGCGSADVPKPDWGWYTKKNDRIYAHILENPIGPLALTGLDAKRVGTVRRLADGSEVLRGESWITNAYENLAFVTLGTIPHFTYLLPDPADTVLEIEYKEACL